MATFLSKRDRARTVALSALVLCCIGFVGSMIYLQSRAAAPATGGTPRDPSPQLIAETEARKKEKILRYRELWQVWAKAHQPQLRAMLHAQPDDLAALQAVVNALPGTPSVGANGFDQKEFEGMKNFSDPVVDATSYVHFKFHLINLTPEQEKSEAKSERWRQLCKRIAFEQLRDVVVVSSSSSRSKKSYCLWASGRVTQSEHWNPDVNKFLHEGYIQVLPPYNFVS